MSEDLVRIRIVDPDFVDRVLVEKRSTVDDALIMEWRLGNYQSTEDIDLENGKFYLSLVPYFERVDPLPVWFKVYNKGQRKLIAKCMLTEGGQWFKDLGIIDAEDNLKVPACLRLTYRVTCFQLSSLNAQNIDGVTMDHVKQLVSIGVVSIRDLLNADKTKISSILGHATSDILEKAKFVCELSINSGKFAKIADYLLSRILKWSKDEIVEKAGVSGADAKKLLSQISDLSNALVLSLFEELRLKDIFWEA